MHLNPPKHLQPPNDLPNPVNPSKLTLKTSLASKTHLQPNIQQSENQVQTSSVRFGEPVIPVITGCSSLATNESSTLHNYWQDFNNQKRKEKQTVAVQGQKRNNDNTAIDNVNRQIAKYRRIASAPVNQPDVVDLVDDDEEDDIQILESSSNSHPSNVAPSFTQSRVQINNRVGLSEFLLKNSSFSPHFIDFYSGNLTVVVFGGQTYTIFDESIPQGWKKKLQGSNGWYSTSYCTPEGNYLLSPTAVHEYLKAQNIQDVSLKDFDFSHDPTIHVNAKILAKDVNDSTFFNVVPSQRLNGDSLNHNGHSSTSQHQQHQQLQQHQQHQQNITNVNPDYGFSHNQPNGNNSVQWPASSSGFPTRLNGAFQNVRTNNVGPAIQNVQGSSSRLSGFPVLSSASSRGQPHPELIDLEDEVDDESVLMNQIHSAIQKEGKSCPQCGLTFESDFRLLNHFNSTHY